MDAPPVQYATTSDGVRIAYAASGTGRPFVMAPSPPSDVTGLWSLPSHRHLFEQLSARYRLIRFDHRGFGRSQRSLPSYSLDDYVKDIEAVVDRLELSSFVLYAGFAVTGQTAVAYAARHPDRVEALVLWNCRVDNGLYYAALHEQAARDSVPLYALARAPILSPLEDSQAWVEMYVQAITSKDLVQIINDCKDISIEDILPLVQAPTLQISRPADPGNAFSRVVSLLPNGRLVYIDLPAAGLFTADGSTPPAVTAIDEFLATVPQWDSLPASVAPDSGLSDREIEVLRLLTQGKSNQQIADQLVISLNTVRRHVSNIFDKTGVANRTEAAGYAREHGLL
jgi:DNA-binding CsgD family transcriptional regulator/pimeloyl-ACP methyl ester carboxylesterase